MTDDHNVRMDREEQADALIPTSRGPVRLGDATPDDEAYAVAILKRALGDA